MKDYVMTVSNIGKKYEILSNLDNKDMFVSVIKDSIKGAFSKLTSNNEKKDFWAVKDISFNVKKGERIGIIGHNGAGKSTLLKIFSRITVPTEGEIKIKGRIASLLEVGTGFHQELTGRENIYLNGSILGMSKEEIESKFDDIVEFSEIGDFLDTPVKRYSSGMYVRLAFAVAAHLDPDILIVDEVLAVGDMKFQEKCLGKMENVAGDGKTVLYVSHSMRTIQQLCNRVIVMDHGKVIFDGDVDEGIKIYMDNNNETSLYQDFTEQKRQDYVTKKAEMLNCNILYKEAAIFNQGEKIKFSLSYKSNYNLNNVRLRAEVLYADNTPAGTALSLPFIDLEPGKNYSEQFELDISQLAIGKYNVIFVLYEKNEIGVFSDIDRVENALCFEVIENEYDKIDWTHRWWGHIKLSNIEKVADHI